MSGNKKYGLILSKQSVNGLKKPAVFDSDSDSPDDAPKDWMKSALQKGSAVDKPKRQTRIEIEKALREDPTVYQYDEIYEELEKSKQKPEEEKKRKERKPKYMEMLMKQAEKRKKENERRLEKQVQKEREAEGDEFKDKEAFITTSYKNKLEELKKLAEEEERMERLEAIGDVTKQKDMTGFYRHLFRSTVTTNNQDESSKIDSGESAENKIESEIPNIKKRKYRKRDSHSSSDEATSETESISENPIENSDLICKVDEMPKVNEEEITEPVENKLPDKKEELEITENPAKIEQPVKPKKIHKDVWAKRTVGEIFEEAVKRYFIRISNQTSEM